MAEDWIYAVAIGANRGPREQTLARAGQLLMADGLARITARSAWHRTAPLGGPGGQEDFLNGAWLVASGLGPHQLLHRLQAIETRLGRVRTVHWGPRTIDLDLLLRDDGLRIANPVLSLPHPRLASRAFVLTPLAEIAGAWLVDDPQHPGGTISIRALARLVASQPHPGP